MNFLLNKIDTDLRKQVYEKTKDGKVHRKEQVLIYKDSSNPTFSTHKDKNKKKIIISAKKYKKDEIEVVAYKEDTTKEKISGTNIDTIK